MAPRRKEKATERSKLDATPPWQTKRVHDHEPTTGPFDITDAPSDELERLDLGALQVPVFEGMEVRVEIGEDQQIAGITLVRASGQMQLGVFAAPRSEGIWDDVRAEIKQSIADQGGRCADTEGEFGAELTGQLPVEGGLMPVRFVGVDGPRWFLRAMLAGGPAVDAAEATDFLNAFRNSVVSRGVEALPVREPIPLSLPKDAAEQVAAAQAEQVGPPPS